MIYDNHTDNHPDLDRSGSAALLGVFPVLGLWAVRDRRDPVDYPARAGCNRSDCDLMYGYTNPALSLTVGLVAAFAFGFIVCWLVF